MNMAEPTGLEQRRSPLPAKLTDEVIADLVQGIQQFEKFKQQALSPKDYTHFGDNQYIEKTGWVKLSMALVINFQIMDDGQRIIGHDGEGEYYTWKFRGRVTTPLGRYVEMDGACSSRDEFFSMANGERRPSAEIDEKDIITTAQTNCFNRCMAFLCGFGELSGEEMRGKQFEKKPAIFPFGDFKGKAPAVLELADLHKLLPFWEKQAADATNKFAANNKKLLAAIQEAIAEKGAKVESPAGPAETATPSPSAASEAPAGEIPPSGGEPTPSERLLVRIAEHLGTGKVTKAALTSYLHKNFCDKAHKEPVCDDVKKLNLLQLQAVSAWLTLV